MVKWLLWKDSSCVSWSCVCSQCGAFARLPPSGPDRYLSSDLSTSRRPPAHAGHAPQKYVHLLWLFCIVKSLSDLYKVLIKLSWSLQLWSTLASGRLNTRPSAFGVRMATTLPWTPAGPASSTLGAVRCPSSSAGTKFTCKRRLKSAPVVLCVQTLTFAHTEALVFVCLLCSGPLNEDVFATRSKAVQPIMCEDVKELQAMIHKLFLQVRDQSTEDKTH